MAKRKAAAGTPTRLHRDEPDGERLLDQFEEAMLAGDAARAQAVTAHLWEQRRALPAILARRLIEGRARIPGLAFELLGGFAGARARTLLRQIANDPAAADDVRFGAMRRAGWPQRGEKKRRLTFLDTLREPDGTLVAVTLQANGSWPPNSEILREVLGYLTALPPERRAALLLELARRDEGPVSWLWHALLHLDDPATQRLALGELARRRDPGAAAALGRLARTARDPALREEAAAAAQRLRLRVVGRDRRSEPPPPLPPVERAVASMIDGSGGQAVLVARRLNEGTFLLAGFFHGDEHGVKDVFGTNWAPGEQVEELLQGFADDELDLVEIELAAARGALAAALETNAARDTPPPPEFELWAPHFHDAYPPAADEPIVAPEVDDTPYAGRQELVRAGGELLDHPFFLSWGFDPQEAALGLMLLAPPASGRWTDKQYRPLIESFATPPVLDRLRRRLRRQAWLLEQAGHARERDLALATAASLADTAPAKLVKHPFLRGMVDVTLGHLAGAIYGGDPWGTR